ncbi:MAG TPA: tRNA lysidine(34) synthetase TilS [Steroidobacter sp.]|nr:tRNA lysidine(34) synthetase TilS [Steroidobacter sp.]
MHKFSPDALLNAVHSLGIADGSALCVALSGGLDSTVLLHALARIVGERARFTLRAAHIDHQLQRNSDRWRAHCEASAAQLNVAFTSACVRVDVSQGGLEAAARRARYAALREMLQPGEVLLTAHHADDQLETVLLGLLRGAGVKGLSGIAAAQPFGVGRLVRPLLSFTRAELEGWAQSEGLVWIDDPSNQNTDLDRNFLRHEIAPRLRERWPALARSATRSAAHLAEAEEILAASAHSDLSRLETSAGLDAAGLADLDPPRRRNALRSWIRAHGARAPSTRKLAAIERDLLTAGADRMPCVSWDDVEIRRYRGFLLLDHRFPPLDTHQLVWDVTRTLELPASLGRLRLIPDPEGPLSLPKLDSRLAVRFRSGGEKLRPAGHAHRHSLKKLLQAAGVPPWRRRRLPLIYSGDRLAAVGDLWVADEFAARAGETAASIIWEKEEVDSR